MGHRYPGGITYKYIPVNANIKTTGTLSESQYIGTKPVELWDSMGWHASNETFLGTAGRFIKDVMAREVTAGRTLDSQ